METVDPGATSERDSLYEGLRVLARIIAQRHMAMADAQSERPSDGDEIDDNHS